MVVLPFLKLVKISLSADPSVAQAPLLSCLQQVLGYLPEAVERGHWAVAKKTLAVTLLGVRARVLSAEEVGAYAPVEPVEKC